MLYGFGWVLYPLGILDGYCLYPLGIDTSASGGNTRLAMLDTILQTYTRSNYLLPVESISDKLLRQKYSTGKY